MEDLELDETEGGNETLGHQLNKVSRVVELYKDPTVRDAAKALLRTVLNVGISIVDAVPGIGDFISWLADAGKISSKTDLTPDVSKFAAWGSEALELGSMGFFPSHAVETVLQYRHDHARLAEGWRRVKEILSSEQRDYEQHRPQIDTAINTFLVAA